MLICWRLYLNFAFAQTRFLQVITEKQSCRSVEIVANITDAEVICTFMEPFPGPGDRRESDWWPINTGQSGLGPFRRRARKLDLDALHEVETRLTDKQQWDYSDLLVKSVWKVYGSEATFPVIHASAADKIKALATVLRPLVECVP